MNLRNIAFAAIAMIGATSANAATMTFSGVTINTQFGAYREAGLTMTPTATGYYFGFQDAGTLHLDQGTSNGIYDFTLTNGGLFDLVSVDVARSYTNTGVGTFSAFDAANVLIGTAAFNANAVGTRALSLTNVSRLRLVSSGSHFNIDNLVLNAVAAVPEPATWAMMLIGFGMVGATTRYRRRATKVVYA